MYDYGIGGQEVPRDAGEAIADIPQNRTLLVEKLTGDDPIQPQIVQGLQTIEDVFKHFNPQISASFQKEDGSSVTEDLVFGGLADFGAKGITKQSKFLGGLQQEKTEYAKFIRQLKTNKILRSVIENQDDKKSLIEALGSLIREIDEA